MEAAEGVGDEDDGHHGGADVGGVEGGPHAVEAEEMGQDVEEREEEENLASEAQENRESDFPD